MVEEKLTLCLTYLKRLESVPDYVGVVLKTRHGWMSGSSGAA